MVMTSRDIFSSMRGEIFGASIVFGILTTRFLRTIQTKHSVDRLISTQTDEK